MALIQLDLFYVILFLWYSVLLYLSVFTFYWNFSDTTLLMNLNQMKAAKQLVLSVVKDYIGINRLSIQ